jgi:hypothetical protein
MVGKYLKGILPAFAFLYCYHATAVVGVETISDPFLLNGVDYYLAAKETETGLSVSVCHKRSCNQLSINGLDGTELESGSLSFRHILLGSVPQLLITTSGDVNVCSLVYRFDYVKNSLSRVNFSGGEMCNISISGEFLTSSYRSSGSWYVDVYKNDIKSPIFFNKNREIDCNEYIQSDPGDPLKTKIVIASGNVSDGRQAIARVKSPKAILFSAPEEAAQTKMYLVSGDEIKLLNFATLDGKGGWYKIEYDGVKKIHKWIRDVDIGPVAGFIPCGN